MNNKWTLTSVEVTKDTTIRWYENEEGYRKRELEKYKYSQYHSYLDKKETTFYDSEGNLIEID